jgi:hypothetical protein
LPNVVPVTVCSFPLVDLPHNEPGDMPGPPLANVKVTVSTSSTSTITLLNLPTVTST